MTNAGTIAGAQTAVANFNMLSNAAGGTILASGSNGVAVTDADNLVGPGTLYNAGLISAGLISGETRAVAIVHVQQVVNEASGTIAGASGAIWGNALTNAGMIASPGGAIDVVGSGSIANGAGGQIIAAGAAIVAAGVGYTPFPGLTQKSTLHIVNAGTIANASTPDEPTLFNPAIFLQTHVELAAHDVVLAEGLPCESYLDTGNRAAWAGGDAMESRAMARDRYCVSCFSSPQRRW